MMLGIPTKIWILLAAVAIAFGSGWKFSRDHYLANAANEKAQAEELAKDLASKFFASEQARRAAEQNLEDLANAQPETAPACLPRERVRRLNLR